MEARKRRGKVSTETFECRARGGRRARRSRWVVKGNEPSHSMLRRMPRRGGAQRRTSTGLRKTRRRDSGCSVLWRRPSAQELGNALLGPNGSFSHGLLHTARPHSSTPLSTTCPPCPSSLRPTPPTSLAPFALYPPSLNPSPLLKFPTEPCARPRPRLRPRPRAPSHRSQVVTRAGRRHAGRGQRTGGSARTGAEREWGRRVHVAGRGSGAERADGEGTTETRAGAGAGAGAGEVGGDASGSRCARTDGRKEEGGFGRRMGREGGLGRGTASLDVGS